MNKKKYIEPVLEEKNFSERQAMLTVSDPGLVDKNGTWTQDGVKDGPEVDGGSALSKGTSVWNEK
jgi:hypothetical protein